MIGIMTMNKTYELVEPEPEIIFSQIVLPCAPKGPKKNEQNIDHDLDKDDAYDHDHYQGNKYMLVLSTEA